MVRKQNKELGWVMGVSCRKCVVKGPWTKGKVRCVVIPITFASGTGCNAH